jgi:hypothetical protein
MAAALFLCSGRGDSISNRIQSIGIFHNAVIIPIMDVFPDNLSVRIKKFP